jgi:two-component system, chemotaxis family, protein-glutamate methylesterase/glutaminase
VQLGRVPTNPAVAFDLVAIAASAGGLSALAQVLASLPQTFPLPVAVVQHLDPNHTSFIAEILGRRTSLRVKLAADDDVLCAGVVYVAPPGTHTEIVAGRVRLTSTKPLHFVRPSADRLFESAAESGRRIIGIVLTGTGSDGAVGVQAIKAGGGFVIVEDPKTSAFDGMPLAAVATGAVDRVLPLGEIAQALIDLTRSDVL